MIFTEGKKSSYQKNIVLFLMSVPQGLEKLLVEFIKNIMLNQILPCSEKQMDIITAVVGKRKLWKQLRKLLLVVHSTERIGPTAALKTS